MTAMLAQVSLKDGRRLDVFRFILPEETGDFPEWLFPFFQYDLPSFWGDYYTDLREGKHTGCRDYLYVGCADGVPCSRMWFGYSRKNGSGNFGNVLTLPEYRKLGIMKILLQYCVADFYASDALFCSCDAAETAAPAYAAAGFRRIFSEKQPPMVIVAKHVPDFSVIVNKAYGNTENAFIREGVFSDRFDCDKLLWYAPEVYEKVERHPELPDYIRLWPWSRKNHAPVLVLETISGFCAGFATLYQGTSLVFLHPAFEKYRKELIQSISKQ